MLGCIWKWQHNRPLSWNFEGWDSTNGGEGESRPNDPKTTWHETGVGHLHIVEFNVLDTDA